MARPPITVRVEYIRALSQFGAPLTELEEADLATPGAVFQIGVALTKRTPSRRDLERPRCAGLDRATLFRFADVEGAGGVEAGATGAFGAKGELEARHFGARIDGVVASQERAQRTHAVA